MIQKYQFLFKVVQKVSVGYISIHEGWLVEEMKNLGHTHQCPAGHK
jgi:hypothetical protein